VILIDEKNESTIHLHLDHEEECMDDDVIMCVHTVSDVVCTSIISQLIRQLMEK